MAKSGGAKQPPWQAQLDSGVPLRLMNSLTRKPEVFVPRSGGRHVRWYSCGPTVYDASHMGHARSYITFDILRRILQDYFMYDVEFVMNITDVDDKIIMKARQHYLYEQYVAGKPDPATVTTDAKEAVDALTKKLEGMTVADEKYGLYTKQLATVEAGLTKLQASASEEALQGLLTSAKDQLSGVLDKRHGSTVKDHSIFTKLTVHWEKEYFKDMRALNVLPPDILTRVTEYVEEIIAFVQKIADNGFAYESNGSVYFNTPKFATCGHHDYAKLVPEAVGDAAALADGEGALATEGEKKSSRDFALWKKSKPGEPAWSSPWGEGRPGWHIECSAMAADAFGELLDIHTGGVDLKFPHHDNEIAQSEAYYGCAQWTNYFLHSGHLNIEGLKMSKSLKNFITIQQALKDHTARQLRFAFLTHQWGDTLNYSSATMHDAIQLEKTFNEFFLNLKATIREKSADFVAVTAEDKAFTHTFGGCKAAVHNALCDNMNTVVALQAMRELVAETYQYLKTCEAAGRQPHRASLLAVGEYLTAILVVFGVIETDPAIGFPVATAGGSEDVAAQMDGFRAAFKAFYSEVEASVANNGAAADLQAAAAAAAAAVPAKA